MGAPEEGGMWILPMDDGGRKVRVTGVASRSSGVGVPPAHARGGLLLQTVPRVTSCRIHAFPPS